MPDLLGGLAAFGHVHSKAVLPLSDCAILSFSMLVSTLRPETLPVEVLSLEAGIHLQSAFISGIYPQTLFGMLEQVEGHITKCMCKG